MTTNPRRSLVAPDAEPWSDPERPIIELKGVRKLFDGVPVIDGLDLVVPVGHSTVIMGESGSGKSVLIKLLNGLLIPDEGDVLLFGVNTRTASRRDLMRVRKRISTLFQNYALFDSMSVFENIAFPLRQNARMKSKEINELVTELLETLGLPDAGGLLPSEISGGMKKRVGLARALITNPEVVLFDEPTTGLDPVMIEFVDEMLVDAKRRYQITSVVISHDMASAFKLGDSLAMLHEGKILFEGSPQETRATDIEEVRRFVHAQTSRLEGDEGNEDTFEEDWGIRWDDLPEPETEPVVTVKDVHKTFGERKILKGMNLFVEPQKITTLIGGSGSGKSVMMKHILGLFQPTAGNVEVFGENLKKLSNRDLLKMRRRFGMLFQSAALFDSMTVRENVAFPLRESPYGKRISHKRALEQADEVLERLYIADLGKKLPSDLSGGQRKRAGLARAIVTRPDIVIYDEPTTGLDPVMTAYVNDMIVEAQEEFEVTALVVSHDMASTFRISHTIAMLYHGRIIAFGSPKDISESTHPRVREFVFAGSF